MELLGKLKVEEIFECGAKKQLKAGPLLGCGYLEPNRDMISRKLRYPHIRKRKTIFKKCIGKGIH